MTRELESQKALLNQKDELIKMLKNGNVVEISDYDFIRSQ